MEPQRNVTIILGISLLGLFLWTIDLAKDFSSLTIKETGVVILTIGFLCLGGGLGFLHGGWRGAHKNIGAIALIGCGLVILSVFTFPRLLISSFLFFMGITLIPFAFAASFSQPTHFLFKGGVD